MLQPQQTIRYVTTRDGVRLAWAACGDGPPLVKASDHAPGVGKAWRHWLQFLCGNFSTVRYDERGCGLSQRDAEDVSEAHWLPDLEDVVEAAQPEKPFVLLGISQGSCAAIQYAIRHPEDVSHLVIYGGYAKGWAMHSNPDHVREGNALVEFTELGLGRPDPLYRRLFTKRFLPEGTEQQNL